MYVFAMSHKCSAVYSASGQVRTVHTHPYSLETSRSLSERTPGQVPM